jgi:hypothetical protein
LEEQGSWGAAPSSNTQQLSLRPSTTSNKIRSSSGSANGSSSGSSNTRLSDEALAVMADLLAQQVLHPQDPAAAATAQLQVKRLAKQSGVQCMLLRNALIRTLPAIVLKSLHAEQLFQHVAYSVCPASEATQSYRHRRSMHMLHACTSACSLPLNAATSSSRTKLKQSNRSRQQKPTASQQLLHTAKSTCR